METRHVSTKFPVQFAHVWHGGLETLMMKKSCPITSRLRGSEQSAHSRRDLQHLTEDDVRCSSSVSYLVMPDDLYDRNNENRLRLAPISYGKSPSNFKSKIKSITKTFFGRAKDNTAKQPSPFPIQLPPNDNVTKESSSHLMPLISLQSYDGSFALNEDLAAVLGKTLKEMEKGTRLEPAFI